MVMAPPNPVSEMNQGKPISSLRLGVPSDGVAQTIATSGTIVHNGFSRVRLTNAGAVTGIIIQDGAFDGQMLILQNETGNTITAATAATSKVLAGTSFVVAANSIAILVWEAALGRWIGAI